LSNYHWCYTSLRIGVNVTLFLTLTISLPIFNPFRGQSRNGTNCSAVLIESSSLDTLKNSLAQHSRHPSLNISCAFHYVPRTACPRF